MRVSYEPSAQPHPIIPPLGALYDALSPLALPMIRVTAGLLLLPHGSQKLFGWFGGKGMQPTAQFFASVGRAGLLLGAARRPPSFRRIGQTASSGPTKASSIR